MGAVVLTVVKLGEPLGHEPRPSLDDLPVVRPFKETLSV